MTQKSQTTAPMTACLRKFPYESADFILFIFSFYDREAKIWSKGRKLYCVESKYCLLSYLVDYHKRSDRWRKDVSIILGNFQALSYYSPTEVNDSYYTDNAGTVWSSRKRPLRMLHNTIISLFTTWTNKNRFPLIDKLCNYVSCKYHSFAKPKEL
jgi:hypothetical protein